MIGQTLVGLLVKKIATRPGCPQGSGPWSSVTPRRPARRRWEGCQMAEVTD